MADSTKPRASCELCGRTFSKASNCNAHIKLVHSDERPHACTKAAGCDKRFKTTQVRTTHERTHTQERPFQCDHCSKSFTQLAHLTVHTRIHTGERPYQCEECGMGFATSSDLTRHTRGTRGGDIACTHCEQLFSQPCLLQAHLRTHIRERPFKCAFCDHRSARSRTVIRHERSMHAGTPQQHSIQPITPCVSSRRLFSPFYAEDNNRPDKAPTLPNRRVLAHELVRLGRKLVKTKREEEAKLARFSEHPAHFPSKHKFALYELKVMFNDLV